MSSRLPRPVGRSRLVAVLLGGLATGLALAAVWLLVGRDELLAAQLTASLAQVSPERADAILAQAERLGPAGVDVLVSGLASPDEQVSRLAARRLTVALDRWEALAPADAAAYLERLMQALGPRAGELPGHARDTAGALTMRVLLWPQPTDDPTRARRVASCERLLRDLRGHQRMLALEPPPVPPRAGGGSERDPRPAFAAALAPLATATLPGGGLPIAGDAPTVSTGTMAGDEKESSPAATPNHGRVAVQPVSTSTGRSSADPHEPAATHGALPVVVSTFDRDEPAPDLPAPRAWPRTLSDRLFANPSSLTSFELCRLTHDSDATTSQSAYAELNRRALPAQLVELGRMLTSPDLSTRLAWTERLTRIAAIDAEPWLMALLDDEAPEVRRAALAILATVPGRQHTLRIAELAASDPAPEVREVAAAVLAKQ